MDNGDMMEGQEGEEDLVEQTGLGLVYGAMPLNTAFPDENVIIYIAAFARPDGSISLVRARFRLEMYLMQRDECLVLVVASQYPHFRLFQLVPTSDGKICGRTCADGGDIGNWNLDNIDMCWIFQGPIAGNEPVNVDDDLLWSGRITLEYHAISLSLSHRRRC